MKQVTSDLEVRSLSTRTSDLLLIRLRPIAIYNYKQAILRKQESQPMIIIASIHIILIVLLDMAVHMYICTSSSS